MAKKDCVLFCLWNTAENLINPIVLRMAKKTTTLPALEILRLPGNLQNVSKSMICSNLSLVRGTQSPECIEYTTFGFRLNPLKNVGNAYFSCGACLSGHSDARWGSCVACNILRLPEKYLGKKDLSHLLPRVVCLYHLHRTCDDWDIIRNFTFSARPLRPGAYTIPLPSFLWK